MFLFSQRILSETFIIQRIIKRDVMKRVYRFARKVPVRSSRKVPVIYVRF
jgi:hypothetical protein